MTVSPLSVVDLAHWANYPIPWTHVNMQWAFVFFFPPCHGTLRLKSNTLIQFKFLSLGCASLLWIID